MVLSTGIAHRKISSVALPIKPTFARF